MKSLFLRVAISAGFLALLFFIIREDLPEIKQVLSRMDMRLCVVAVLLFLSTTFILAKRLQIIFAAKEVSMKLREATSLTFVGYFFNNFLPTSVGGDIVKAMCAARVTKKTVQTVTTVVMDRVFGLFTFVLIPSISFLFFLKQINNPAVPVLIYSLLLFSFFSFFMLFNRNLARRFSFVETFLNRLGIGPKIRQIYDGLHSFKHHKDLMVKAMLLSFVAQAGGIIVLYVLAVALGAKASLIYFFLLVPVVHLISMLPSFNGLGIREGAYVYFLAPIMGKEYAAAISILWLGLLLLLSLIGGLIYMIRHDYHIRFKEATV